MVDKQFQTSLSDRMFLTQLGADTEAARASRKQYKETLYSVLFEMNVPAVCAVDQVSIFMFPW